MRVQLGLGSNLGDREAMLKSALSALDAIEKTRVMRVSTCYETEPLGPQGQPAYLNLAAEVETALEPLELLREAKAIERGLGRQQRERWGPREIDIDIILWGSRMEDTEELTLPHKEFRNRAFVLAPLADIAAEAVDPVTGSTVGELAARMNAGEQVRRFGEVEY